MCDRALWWRQHFNIQFTVYVAVFCGTMNDEDDDDYNVRLVCMCEICLWSVWEFPIHPIYIYIIAYNRAALLIIFIFLSVTSECEGRAYRFFLTIPIAIYAILYLCAGWKCRRTYIFLYFLCKCNAARLRMSWDLICFI